MSKAHPAPIEGDVIDAQLEADGEAVIRQQARSHAPRAIETLYDIMTDDAGPSVSVRRQAAKDLLEIGIGKPAQMQPSEVTNNSLTVNILQLGKGEGLDEIEAKTAKEIGRSIDPKQIDAMIGGEKT